MTAAALTARVCLDWRGPEHYGRSDRPCRACRGATRLRDESGRACHKTCAEQEIAAELLGSAGRRDERLLSPAKQKGITR
jgi:hypothetical protein